VSRLLNHFLRGLLFVVPIAVTAYVCYIIFVTIDGLLGEWLGLTFPGAGFALTLVLITALGFLAESLITRGLLNWFEKFFQKVPFIRLVYGSVRDFLDAFVGEKRRFDRPVLVDLDPVGHNRALGFVTQETLDNFEASGHVAVYMPFSYSIAGWVQVFPATAVRRLDVDSAEMMAFIVSGGVTGLPRVKPGSELATRRAASVAGNPGVISGSETPSRRD
jgi:uncharacterized membrane protein